MKEFYGNHIFNVNTVRCWASVAQQNLMHLLDLPHARRPKVTQREELKKKVNEQIPENRPRIQRQLARKLGVSQAIFHKLTGN